VTNRTDIEALRAKAEAATPGPWMLDDDTHVLGPDGTSILAETDGDAERGETYTPEDAAHIAACSPDVILSLLRELELLRKLEHAASNRDWLEVADQLNELDALEKP